MVNAKLSAKSTEIMQRAVELQFAPETLALFKYVLQGLSFRNSSKNKVREYTVFGSRFYEKVLALYREDNRNLAKKYIDINRLRRDSPGDSSASDKTSDDTFERKSEELIDLLLSRRIN